MNIKRTLQKPTVEEQRYADDNFVLSKLEGVIRVEPYTIYVVNPTLDIGYYRTDVPDPTIRHYYVRGAGLGVEKDQRLKDFLKGHYHQSIGAALMYVMKFMQIDRDFELQGGEFDFKRAVTAVETDMKRAALRLLDITIDESLPQPKLSNYAQVTYKVDQITTVIGVITGVDANGYLHCLRKDAVATDRYLNIPDALIDWFYAGVDAGTLKLPTDCFDIRIYRNHNGNDFDEEIPRKTTATSANRPADQLTAEHTLLVKTLVRVRNAMANARDDERLDPEYDNWEELKYNIVDKTLQAIGVQDVRDVAPADELDIILPTEPDRYLAMAQICAYSQSYFLDHGYPDSKRTAFDHASYIVSCFLAAETADGEDGVEHDVVLAVLMGKSRRVAEWVDVIRDIVKAYGGFKQ